MSIVIDRDIIEVTRSGSSQPAWPVRMCGTQEDPARAVMQWHSTTSETAFNPCMNVPGHWDVRGDLRDLTLYITHLAHDCLRASCAPKWYRLQADGRSSW